MRHIFLILGIAFALVSCREDEIDPKKSIFDTGEVELTGFDKWLDDNYRLSYNIQFRYKYEDLESNMDYNLIPARMDKAVQMAQIVKFIWLDAYTEVVGLDFTRKYSPRIISLIGSGAYKSSTMTLGTAESGKKVNLFNINEFDHADGAKIGETYANTMHHEFAHILHQTKLFDLAYADWGAPYYVGSNYNNQTERQAFKRGFISRYSMYRVEEDFVEIFCHYVTHSDAFWARVKEETLSAYNASLYDPDPKELTGEDAWAIIEAKIEFVRKYMKEKWGLDIDMLRQVVRRRTGEVSSLVLKTEDEF